VSPQTLTCDMACAELATHLIGEVQTGDQLAVCDAHLIVWSLSTLDDALSPEAKAAVAARWAPEGGPDGGDQDPGQAAEPRAPRGRRRPRRGPEASEPAEDPPEGTTAAVAAHSSIPAE